VIGYKMNLVSKNKVVMGYKVNLVLKEQGSNEI